MSKENLDQFIQKVTDSEELQARIGEEMDADSLIALGAEHGCEFSAEDLAADVELSDEELDGVAGGGVYAKLDGVAGGALSIYTNLAAVTLVGSKYRIGSKHAPGTVSGMDSETEVIE
jgi:predicted ribosomally synthesized peptide with nif11-like leader|tara:strand:+ start:127 stop:480 length:354 start_codon:yes stop_codon:yes gene_type:complete